MKSSIRALLASPTLQTISGLAGSNLFAAILGIVGSLVQARFVTPEDLGYFRQFSIATGYAFFLHLGLFGALQRFYPYYIGKGQQDKAIAVAEICQAWNVAVSALVSGAFVVLALASLTTGNWRAMLGWLVQAVAMTGFIYGGYLGATYRSGHDFATVARGSIISSVVSTLTLPLFVIAPYVALVVRSSVGSLTNLVYLHLHRPLRLRWRFEWREWRDLLKEGLPMFVASYGGSTGWSVVETSLILSFLGTVPLGLWSISFMLLEFVNKVPQAITAVYIPRLTETFGRTESVVESMRVCRKPMLWGTPAMLVLAGGICLMLPLVVPVLMPHYIAAIPTMALMMLTLPILVLELPYALLVAMGKLVQQNIATYVGLGVFALLALLTIQLGWGLNGVVGASLLGRVIRLSLTYWFIYSGGLSKRIKR